MDLGVAFKALLKSSFLPPGGPLLLIVVGLLVLCRFRRLGVAMILTGATVLTALSLPVTAMLLRGGVEIHPPITEAELSHGGAEAIVILGGWRYVGAREYGGQDVVNLATLGRLRYGARLHRASGLPMLVSGGRPWGEAVSEATLMAESLHEDFRIRPRWLEGRSRDTFENARFSAEILKGEGIRRVVLVTHATHMARSVEAFERAGLEVLAAPTLFAGDIGESEWRDWLPSPKALGESRDVLHELLGRIWYRVAHYRGGDPTD